MIAHLEDILRSVVLLFFFGAFLFGVITFTFKLADLALSGLLMLDAAIRGAL